MPVQKPRLLILLNRLAVGGPAINTLSVAAILCNRFDILLVAGEPLADEQPADFLLEQYKGFEVKKIKSLQRSVLPLKDLQSFVQLKKIIKTFQPQIVHTHGAKPGVLGRIAAWQCNVPVVVHTFHGHVFHSYFSRFFSKQIIRIEQLLARISTAIIAINEKLQHELMHQYRIAAAEKVQLIRLGINTEQFADPDLEKRKRFRNEFSIAETDFVIGIVGRLVPVKQHRLFIETAELLLQNKGITKTLRFFIIGDGAENEMLMNTLQKKNISYTQSGHVFNTSASFVFTSWRNDMDAVYAGLDLVMLTSLNEGTPVSVMEAMAAGKAVVSTNAGGIAEMIVEGQTGSIAEGADALSRAVLKLIENNELRKEMGRNASANAALHFSKQAETDRLCSLYNQLLQQKTASETEF